MYNSDPEKGLRTNSGFVSALPDKFKVNISNEIFGKWEHIPFQNILKAQHKFSLHTPLVFLSEFFFSEDRGNAEA